MLAPLLDTQPLAPFKPTFGSGKPDEEGVLVPIKTFRRFITRKRLRSPCIHRLFQRDSSERQGAIAPPLTHSHVMQSKGSLRAPLCNPIDTFSGTNSLRLKGVPAPKNPVHVHGGNAVEAMSLRRFQRDQPYGRVYIASLGEECAERHPPPNQA